MWNYNKLACLLNTMIVILLKSTDICQKASDLVEKVASFCTELAAVKSLNQSLAKLKSYEFYFKAKRSSKIMWFAR